MQLLKWIKKRENKPVFAVQTTKQKPDSITARIVNQAEDLSRKDIKRWRNALAQVYDIEKPNRIDLQYIYKYLSVDAHLRSLMQLRTQATVGTKFLIKDRNGKIDTDKMRLFEMSWFSKLLVQILDSIYYGYTLIELTDVNTWQFTTIPRQNVIPERGIVLTDLTQDTGIDYTADQYSNTLIEIGQTKDIGILNDIVTELIYKKSVKQSWAEFTERFGFPFVFATTTRTDKPTIDNIENQLRSLGESAGGVFPEGTRIELTEAKRTDAYQTYNELIERCNGEISKRILGGTMITDEGSSRSQSEVHERQLNEKIIEADHREIEFLMNEQIIPLLIRNGFALQEGDVFEFDRNETLTLLEQWTITRDILQTYEVPTEWIEKTFGVPVGNKKPMQMVAEGVVFPEY